MTDKKREPLLSEKAIYELPECTDQADTFLAGGMAVREIYEAARTKDAELIQMLMDALHDHRSIDEYWTAENELAWQAATAAGFKPSND